jgi:chemotaxis protein CheD
MSTLPEIYNCVIQPGHLAYSQESSLIFTVCGNGVVVTLRDKIRGIGGIAHCIYPNAKTGEEPSHYHADTALKSLFKVFGRATLSAPHRFEAQLIGGGNYKGVHRARAEEVIKLVRKHLKKMNIEIVSEDLGGSLGRKVIFNTSSGETMVLKTSKVRRTDWLPELAQKYGLARVAFKRAV